MDDHKRNLSMLFASALGILLLVLVVFPASAADQGPLSTTFQSPLNNSRQVWLPLVSRSFTWSKMGVAPAGGSVSRSLAIFGGSPRYWYHTWDPACGDPYDPSGFNQRHIPLVRPWSVDAFLSDSFQFGPCNDGRPVLVLNEPEDPAQDGVAPEVALDIVLRVANSSWRGPVHVGGTVLQKDNYIDQMLDKWALTHEGSRLIPGVDGFHVHPYVNLVPGMSYDLRGTDLIQKVDVDIQKLREFVAERKAEGYSGGVVISEFGYLGRVSHIGRRDSDMVALLDRYVVGFSSIPEVLGWAWFSDYCPPSPPPPAPPTTNAWDVSNLVFENGALTPVGEKYHTLLQTYQ